MTATRILVALLLVFAASSARAQPSTAEGVDAFVRGDYQRAAEILKPIAHDSLAPDHVAEFFMAAMYDSGRGVPADPMRACAFSLRASIDRGPFGMQAMAIVMGLRRRLSRDDFEECSWRERVGFDHGFEQVTFALGSGHWIAWDLKGATVTYAGNEKRVAMPLAQNHAVVLPLRHTELAVGRTRSARRHFVEIFTWLPGPEQRRWSLSWVLVEVLRDGVIPVGREQLTTITASEPPRSFDVRASVQLGVNDAGDAEWVRVDHAPPRATVIETEADRAEQEEFRQQAHARNAADSRVDWKRKVDLLRPPALLYVDANSCEGSFVYGWSGDRTEAITLQADANLRALAMQPRPFDLAGAHSAFKVTLHLSDSPVQSWPFCTDVGHVGTPLETWRATKGTVTIELSPRIVDGRLRAVYGATLRIEGVEFVNGAGVRVRQERPITLRVLAR